MKYYECFALIAELSRNKIYLKHKLYYTGMTQKDQGMTHKDTSQLAGTKTRNDLKWPKMT